MYASCTGFAPAVEGLEGDGEEDEAVVKLAAVPDAGEEDESAAAATLSSARLRCLSKRVCSDSLRSVCSLLLRTEWRSA